MYKLTNLYLIYVQTTNSYVSVHFVCCTACACCTQVCVTKANWNTINTTHFLQVKQNINCKQDPYECKYVNAQACIYIHIIHKYICISTCEHIHNCTDKCKRILCIGCTKGRFCTVLILLEYVEDHGHGLIENSNHICQRNPTIPFTKFKKI